MKLNLREIKVLARTLAEKINDERDAREKEAFENYKPSAEYKILSKKIDKYNELGEVLHSSFGVRLNPILKEDALKFFIRRELGIEESWISTYTIEDAIVLAQIECSGVDAIVEKVKAEYV